MKLVWKLLRQHISIPQFLGFFLANLVGMVIILVGVQFFNDINAVYDSEDSLMSGDYLIVNKKIGALTTIAGNANSFSKDEIEELEGQDFVKSLGKFTASEFTVHASFNIEGMTNISTDMFFEAVPDEFVDVKSDRWTYTEGSTEIPIVLPRNYLDLYNFGYAQGKDLPKLSEGILGAIKLRIIISGKGKHDEYVGKIAGFSSRLNTILVPLSFMSWANSEYANSASSETATRLIVEVDDPGNEQIATYIQDHNYQTDNDKLKASKSSYILRVIESIVVAVGLLICVLSFYILMLSVFLLVQKNSTKLENLLLIGYSPSKVAFPYQALTVSLNALVLIIAFVIMILVRNTYLTTLYALFPDFETAGIEIAMIVGLVLLLIVSLFNVIAVRSKVMSIWHRKD